MSFEPVNSWDMRVLAGGEGIPGSGFGTTPNPVAGQALELISCTLGKSEVGQTRPKQDRNVGRGNTNAWVEGRVPPIDFALSASMKSRSAVDTVPLESAVYAAAGLLKTVNGGTSVVYSPTGTPVEDGSFSGLSLYRAFGPAPTANPARYEAQQLRGGVVKSLVFSGGDKELVWKATGAGIGKYHLGYTPSITLADGSGTSLTLSAEDSYKMGQGWYQVESEIIKITENLLGATTRTIARAQLGSTGAAHAAKILYPYFPAISYTGSPIPEPTAALTVDGQTLRVLSFDLSIMSGIDLLPGETGSKYIQGIKDVRYSSKLSVKMRLHREDVALEGKATGRKDCAVSLVQGTGVGGIVTFAYAHAELRPFEVPDTAGDTVVVGWDIEARDNAGNDMWTITFT